MCCCSFEQHFGSFEKTLDEFCLDFRVAFRKGKRGDPSLNLVCEVDPSLRNVLLKKERLYVSLCSCRFVDSISVSRCFKCQDFGHMAKFCRGKEVCRHCGLEGHKSEGCPTPDGVDVCPCNLRKLEHQHRVGSADCAVYQRSVR